MVNGPALLTTHLREKGLTIRAFAKRVGVSSSAVFAWMTRERRPGADARLAIERVAGIPFSAWSKPKPRRAVARRAKRAAAAREVHAPIVPR